MRLIKLKITALFVAFILIMTSEKTVFAHGFGERYDLPIPLNYFILGSVAIVALSFFVIGWFVRQNSQYNDYAQFNIWNRKSIRIILKISKRFLNVFSVFLLILTILSGLLGTESALDNFAPTFVWIIWWVGFGYLVAIFGNVWVIVNPWSVIFKYIEKIFKNKFHPIKKWPSNLDAWPALIVFFIFAWFENAYTGSSAPKTLAISLIIYTVYSLGGMIVFGKHVWLTKADPFFVLFSLFSRFSMTEIRVITFPGNVPVCESCASCSLDTTLNDCVDCYECWEYSSDKFRKFSFRPFASGLARGEKVSGALVAFHITALAIVTFDGFAETPAWLSIQNTLWPIFEVLPFSTIMITKTLGLIFFPVFFSGMYIFVCRRIANLSQGIITYDEVVKSFVFSLVPIALAYNLSHYISFLLITGQQLIPLLSDPFGCNTMESSNINSFICFTKWNLFGTIEYIPNISVINAKFAWIISVIVLVGGHIISVFVAHLISLRKLNAHKLVVQSQYPMLILMVFYTGISLWIIAQPIVD